MKTTKFPKKSKLKSIKSLKKRALKWLSIYIRTRDCSDTTGTLDFGKCFTCGKPCDFKNLQAGHFVQGRLHAVLFDERNVHAQCYRCNVPLKGNLIEYYPRMLKKYGKKVIEELKEKNRGTRKFKRWEYEGLIEKFKSLTKEYGRNI